MQTEPTISALGAVDRRYPWIASFPMAATEPGPPGTITAKGLGTSSRRFSGVTASPVSVAIGSIRSPITTVRKGAGRPFKT